LVAIFLIETASRPSVSAISIAAATIASRESGCGPAACSASRTGL
jgi:hypothetical protein